MLSDTLPKCRVLGIDISIGTFAEHIRQMGSLASQRKSSYVCCVNAHMTVEASREAEFRNVVNSADFATADGMPITKCVRWLGGKAQERVAGNDLMPAILQEANERGLSVYLYGGQDEVLHLIQNRIRREFPNLVIAGLESPPFRKLTDEEMVECANRINASGANIVLVSLGCPKQERWMAAMHGSVHALMLGVGGAFLLYAGKDTRAPLWMRNMCLEWMYRLALEPKRLWKRFLVTNTLFIWMFLNSWIQQRFLRLLSRQS